MIKRKRLWRGSWLVGKSGPSRSVSWVASIGNSIPLPCVKRSSAGEERSSKCVACPKLKRYGMRERVIDKQKPGGPKAPKTLTFDFDRGRNFPRVGGMRKMGGKLHEGGREGLWCEKSIELKKWKRRRR